MFVELNVFIRYFSYHPLKKTSPQQWINIEQNWKLFLLLVHPSLASLLVLKNCLLSLKNSSHTHHRGKMSLEKGLVTTLSWTSKCQEKILKILPCECFLQFLTGCRGEVCWPSYYTVENLHCSPLKWIGSSVASMATLWFRDPQTLQRWGPSAASLFPGLVS